MDQSSQPKRIMSVALTSRGFGYAVLEGKNSLITCGNKTFDGDKNLRSLSRIEKMITSYKPDVLVLDDVNARGIPRALRIKKLHRKVVALAKERKLKTLGISGTKLRSMLLGDERGTKHAMAESLAKRFPDELASRLPPKRKHKTGDSEDVRMDMFDAVGLVVGSIINNASPSKLSDVTDGTTLVRCLGRPHSRL
jgi:hypothetical protein